MPNSWTRALAPSRRVTRVAYTLTSSKPNSRPRFSSTTGSSTRKPNVARSTTHVRVLVRCRSLTSARGTRCFRACAAGGLSACAGLREVKMGVQIHGVIAKSCCSSDVYMGSALIDMYSKFWNVSCTQRVFDCMSVRNVVSGNSLITCYEQNGPAREAVQVFLRMMDMPRQQV
ncbi:hypothetical protein ACLB2K_073352 [Fragaria x ananassa]